MVDQSESANSRTSSSLLERIKACEQDAWVRLVQLYSPLIYAWCRQFGLQAADAADVGQEVFRAVARKISDFRRDRPGDSFRAWLRTITRNRVRDHFSALAVRAQGHGGSDAQIQLQQIPANIETDSAVSSEADNLEAGLLYRRAMDLIRSEFEDRSWQAFWSVVVEEQSPDSVAERLGLSRNAVYLAKSRILRRLRAEFNGLIDD